MQKFSATKEIRKLNKICAQIPADKKKLVEGLVSDAAFMAEQLEILRDHIIEYGWSEEYQNGANQYGRKATVEADTYLKMQKSYAAVVRQLTDLLPDDKTAKEAEAGDALAAFIKAGK